jgi:hypothetical protein
MTMFASESIATFNPAIQLSPHREIELDPGRAPMPVRGVAI